MCMCLDRGIGITRVIPIFTLCDINIYIECERKGCQKYGPSPKFCLYIPIYVLLHHNLWSQCFYSDVRFVLTTNWESSYGEGFYLRAAATRDYGIGALPPEEAIYFFTVLV